MMDMKFSFSTNKKENPSPKTPKSSSKYLEKQLAKDTLEKALKDLHSEITPG